VRNASNALAFACSFFEPTARAGESALRHGWQINSIVSFKETVLFSLKYLKGSARVKENGSIFDVIVRSRRLQNKNGIGK
jgi:hypothetical protein